MFRKTILFFFTLVAIIVMIATMLIFAEEIVIAEAQSVYWKNSSYDYIFEYKGEVENPNSYYVLTDKVVIQSQSGKKVQATILMEKKTCDYSVFSSKKMNSNEIIISNNLLKAYNLSDDEQFYLTEPINDYNICYQNQIQTEKCFSLTSTVFNRYSGLIIIGYQEKIASSLNLSSYTFMNENADLTGQYTLVKIHSKTDLIHDVDSLVWKKILYVGSLILIEIATMFMAICSFNMATLRHLLQIGMKVSGGFVFLLKNGIGEIILALMLATIAVLIYVGVVVSQISVSLMTLFFIELLAMCVFSVLILCVAKKKV